ncbi:MAG: cobalt-precorrin 5A hydrolase, partial [Desulfobacterales bacterium]|nr:cobalt-precorrin 5A hydrolase [Desulfobacterales bacterium]
KQFKSHIFIFSTGIAVRMIAPLLQSKDKDPAVVVVDEKGFHVISLISGHLGGANELCKKIAEKINAVPVITTATDINHLPSIDLIAKDENLFIENIEAIKNVNMAFLKNIPIKIDDPANLLRTKIPRTLLASSKTIKDIDIACTWKIVKVPRETLILRPKNLFIGVGCNRGTPSADIHEFVTHVFKEEGLSLNSIAAIGTTSVKSDERGILDLAEKLDRPIIFYEKDELNSVTSIKNPSEMAKKHLGVNSVCEAAAILGAQGGSLIVQKKKTRDVTLAVAIQQ